MRFSRSLLTIFLPLVSLACGGREQSPFEGMTGPQRLGLAGDLARARGEALRVDLAEAFAVRPPRNVLVLSGGDAHGAFGCGVLAGWRDSAKEARPVFDIVTGVSTGALIATFAFLGEERDDATVREVYTTARDSDIFDGLFAPAPASAVFNTAPLKRLIARHVTEDAIRRVAAAHRDGRRLYATTVELDTGAVTIWPLSRIASQAVDSAGTVDANGVERFRKVLLAAAAIPVMFPPVEIDGGLHVDAGLREAVTLRRVMLGTRQAGASSEPKPTVWAIVNGTFRTEPETVGNDLPSIGMRSLTLYTGSLVLMSVRDAAHIAEAHSPAFRFRWIAEPDELQPQPTPGLFTPMFEPGRTKLLYETGVGLMRKESAWREGPPGADVDP